MNFLGEKFNEGSAGFEDGSAIVSIDYDIDGTPDTTTTFLGDFDLTRFFLVPDETGTRVIYSKSVQYQSSEGSDVLIGNAGSDSFLALEAMTTSLHWRATIPFLVVVATTCWTAAPATTR